MTPRYKRDLLGNQIPEVRAAAAIVFDPQTNAVLWEQNAHDQRSIASLTKLMTARDVRGRRTGSEPGGRRDGRRHARPRPSRT